LGKPISCSSRARREPSVETSSIRSTQSGQHRLSELKRAHVRQTYTHLRY